MNSSSSPDVLILGAGALGLCTAAEFARRGARVLVVDPGSPSASSVAAGMLAPAMETALETSCAGHASLLRLARDLWPAMAEAAGVRLYREGAEWRGADLAAVQARLTACGFEARPTVGGVFTPDDWRLEPDQALKALASLPDIEHRSGAGRAIHPDGSVTLTDGAVLRAARLVLATGAGAQLEAPPDLARLLARIVPIKGQVVRLRGSAPPHVIRGPGVYVAPGRGGAVVGATMETGRGDCAVEDSVTQVLLGRARALIPALSDSAVSGAQAAVRGASPDGLPMAGAISMPGVDVALAPRRNGWLLGPLVARVIVDGATGRPPDKAATALRPDRFD